MRKAIDEYYADKQKYPASLDALVSEKYLREIKPDPFTLSVDTWQTTMSEPDAANPSAETRNLQREERRARNRVGRPPILGMVKTMFTRIYFSLVVMLALVCISCDSVPLTRADQFDGDDRRAEPSRRDGRQHSGHGHRHRIGRDTGAERHAGSLHDDARARWTRSRRKRAMASRRRRSSPATTPAWRKCARRPGAPAALDDARRAPARPRRRLRPHRATWCRLPWAPAPSRPSR